MMPRLTSEFREYVYPVDLGIGALRAGDASIADVPIKTRTVTARFSREHDAVEVQTATGVVVLSAWLVEKMSERMNVYQAIDEAARLAAYRNRSAWRERGR